MTLLFDLHSIVRWVILLGGTCITLKFLAGWLLKTEFQKLDRILAAGLSGILDLQALIGFGYLIWDGVEGAGFPRYRWEHALLMIVAAVIAHISSRWQKEPSAIRFRNTAFLFAASLLIIIAGVTLLPGDRW